jgi:hypothetical protein
MTRLTKQSVFTFMYTNRLLLFIFSVIAILRLWKIPNYFIYTFSEEWQGTLAWELVKDFHLIWIGVSQANIHFYLGSGFIYLNYLLLFLGNGHLETLAYASAFLGLITTACLYYVTREIFSKRVAVFAGIFYGCSTLINYYDRRFWNPSFIPVMTILFVYSLIKSHKDTRWLILTSALIASAFHLHLLMLLFVIPTLYCVIKNIRKIRLSTWLVGMAVYVIIISPLIVFDLVHNFDNFLVPYHLLFGGGGKNELYSFSIPNMLSHWQTFLNMMGRVWFLKLHTNLQTIALETETTSVGGNLFLALGSIFALIWFFLKNRRPGFGYFLFPLIGYPLIFLIYPSYNPEYYLMSFITLLAIVIGFWLSSLPKIVSYTMVILFMIINAFTVITTTDDYGLTMRRNLVEKTMPVLKGQNFYLETTGPRDSPQYTYAGWRTIYKLYGQTPGQSSVDSVLGWIYPDEISKSEPDLRLVVVQDMIPTFQTKPLYEYHSGVYGAYIFSNP